MDQSNTKPIEPVRADHPDGVLKGRHRMQSSFIFRGRREVVIVHSEQEYILRITRNGRLILTK
jgi:hemin uptake protein HemP